MKTLLLVEDGRRQIILTPDDEHEKSILQLIENKDWNVRVKHGSYYQCQGGWTRETDYPEIDSLMIVLDEVKGKVKGVKDAKSSSV